ncbi:hypothetical protein L1987_16258 [Smallanthus sonchifolius]|uniref:Uncharacterized protein n=1 Tax=Smallanthus sonchifolius TaxID=185202 RepID=A0ACB9JA21_9ASTR|nr:hypothetical protein L1987_16258 [Smallanthus sonchifolius]
MANLLTSFKQKENKNTKMQTCSFFHPLTPPGAPFCGKLQQPNRAFVNDHNRPATMAFKKDGSGKMVDENMITLRERIRKMKAEMETNDGADQRLPDDWMQWEKTYIYSGCYHSDVYEVVAFLQRFLMDIRPSVALGLVALFIVGGSTMAVMVLQCLINSIHGN